MCGWQGQQIGIKWPETNKFQGLRPRGVGITAWSTRTLMGTLGAVNISRQL